MKDIRGGKQILIPEVGNINYLDNKNTVIAQGTHASNVIRLDRLHWTTIPGMKRNSAVEDSFRYIYSMDLHNIA